MNGRAYSVRMEGAKYGVSFGSALARDFLHDDYSILLGS